MEIRHFGLASSIQSMKEWGPRLSSALHGSGSIGAVEGLPRHFFSASGLLRQGKLKMGCPGEQGLSLTPVGQEAGFA